MEIARISRLYYAADMAQAGAILGPLPTELRFPIDVDALTHACAHPVGGRRMPSAQALGAEAAGILDRWATQAIARHRGEATKGQP